MNDQILKIITQTSENARDLKQLSIEVAKTDRLKSVALQMASDALAGSCHVLRGVFYIVSG